MARARSLYTPSTRAAAASLVLQSASPDSSSQLVTDQIGGVCPKAAEVLEKAEADALGYLDADVNRVVRDGDGGFRRLGGLLQERRAQAAGECAAWESWNLSAYLASRGGTE